MTNLCVNCGNKTISKKYKICEECEMLICNDFNKGLSKVRLAKKYNLSDRGIGLIIERNGYKNIYKGEIYFIMEEDGEFIKIGQSKYGIKNRLINLQVGNPHKLILLGTIETEDLDKTELEIHSIFKEFRYRGEWFYFNDKIKDFITKKLTHRG